MSEVEKKIIQIPEITRVEGHAAVEVDIEDGIVKEVRLDVFEGTRFFERIVLGHKYDELAHITSRVCAICSTGHVLAAIFAVERIFSFTPSLLEVRMRELMHLGMIIESHATHICALALPDFLNTPDLATFASRHKNEFLVWTQLRNLGAEIQTVIGGRPFHPVNLHAGGLSKMPTTKALKGLKTDLAAALSKAIDLAKLVLSFKPAVSRLTEPYFLALIPTADTYGYFGNEIKSSEGWQRSAQEYREYLDERVVSYSHAKQSVVNGKPVMVGAIARLSLFGDRLPPEAMKLFKTTELRKGDSNSMWNNAAQSIEIVQAIERAIEIIEEAEMLDLQSASRRDLLTPIEGAATGAVECPRGTLYHYYKIDEKGKILEADMITPSAQNTARIEMDIKEIVGQNIDKEGLMPHLETLVRAYDPCNTCATHMVSINYKQ